MSNLFKIPRTKFARTDARWALVRKHGTSRRKMVDFICNIGGYSVPYYGRYAIEFNIGVYSADLDVDHLWSILKSSDIADTHSLTLRQRIAARKLFDTAHATYGDRLWTTAVEDAYRGWADSDMPYETFAGVRVDWSWETHGRGGKHLCMTECEGINLKRNEEDLREALMERDENPDGTRAGYMIDIERVKKLFLICVQNSVELNSDNISREVEYRAAWTLWYNDVEGEVDDVLEKEDEDAELRIAVPVIRSILLGVHGEGSRAVTAFDEIAKRAGFDKEEE